MAVGSDSGGSCCDGCRCGKASVRQRILVCSARWWRVASRRVKRVDEEEKDDVDGQLYACVERSGEGCVAE